ncbi:protein kinase domain-containing protein [Vibrio owensii]|uniref:protein kinase domain-containing protein n=1 Tax=Vibrio owensii TaxID=696485 RepID=UPI0005EE67FC|nr:protein kinase [Vibrio owensii]
MNTFANQTLFRACGVTYVAPLSESVFQCEHKLYGTVVIKVARSLAEKRALMVEADFLSEYASDYWANFHGYGSQNHADWLMSQYLEGKTLNAIEPDLLPQDIITKLEFALLNLHKTGYLHGDIKPHNVIVTPNNQVRLIDFGSVIRVEAKYREHSHTTVSRAYSATRPCLRIGQASKNDDFYALAMTLLSCHDQHPFAGLSLQEAAELLPAPSNIDLPTRYQVLIQKEWQRMRHSLKL